MGYLDNNGRRRVMSIRRLLPPSMQSRSLMSLSFDERIHYSTEHDDGEMNLTNSHDYPLNPMSEVFVDCGAFNYSKMEVPRFTRGGFVSLRSALEEYTDRHLSKLPDAKYILCSPDHIVTQDMSDEETSARLEFTRRCASSFIDITSGEKNVKPIAVVHGRTTKEKAEITDELVEMGYDYIAFGGLVPMARGQAAVISQLTGSDDLSNSRIGEDSPLGIAKAAGVKTHIFGLNSPDWYRWWKRMGIDSFDGSKLSQEGAANGMIWIENGLSMEEVPNNASALYQRLKVKNITRREILKKGVLRHFQFSDDGEINPDNPAWEYLMSARCTSPKCPHGPDAHNCDPRVTGSIEHNMGRTLLNAWAFDSIMGKIDKICEEAKSSDDDNLVENWSPIEVE